MNNLYLVVLYNFRGNDRLRVFLTAPDEDHAKVKARDEWSRGRELDRVDLCEFLCTTPDHVNKAI